MALIRGTQIGPYEIIDKLGAGGMGEVYRAADAALQRDVAIKVLPDSFASDAERIARFEQEARILASLNHANIAHIYGLERSEGTAVLVMELVEGPTLEDRIASGPLPADEALAIARQIADALEAAHTRQIVHRDLKPANIKLRPDGTVKVLDFGIAKALSAESATTESPSPVMTTPATQVGLILGTAAYMSPEQARGKEVDQRTDIWAFGVLLYEMLSGQLAFGAEDVPTTLARVIANDASLDSLPAAVSPAVRRTIELCLRKDPRRRVADIRDVKLALDGAFETVHSSVSAATPASGRWRSPAVLVGLAGVLLACAASLAVFSAMRPGPAHVMRFDVSPEYGFTIGDTSRSIALSPDGQRFAYLRGGAPQVGADEIRLRELDALESTLLVAETAIGSPFFSPDGSELGYYSINPPTLKRVSVRGGPPSVVTPLDANMNGASWGEDGRIYFATRNTGTGLWAVPALGGTAELLTTPDTAQGELEHFWPAVLPGGRAVLFTIARGDGSQVAVLDLDTGAYRPLVSGSFPVYAPTGHLLYGLDGTLWAVPFDLDRLETTGVPVPVVQGIVTKGALSSEVAFAADGSLLYVAGSGPEPATTERELVWVDAAGAQTLLDAPPRPYEQVQVSPDGTRVAVQIDDEIWIWGGPGRLDRLTFDGGPNIGPMWLAEGTAVAYMSGREGGGIYAQPSDGTGSARRLLDVAAAPFGEAVDGALVYMTLGEFDIGVVPAGGGSGELLIATSASEVTPALSPNGRWLAYSSNESGRGEIYVRGYPEIESLRRLVSADGGRLPLWSADGRTLYYVDNDGPSLMAAAVVSEEPFATRTPERLFSLEEFNLGLGKVYDVAPDGRFLFIRPSADAANRMILVQNFFAELERLVPTK
jgi:Tol biopolymer transport system component